MFAKRKTCVPRIAYNVKLTAKRIYVKLNPQLSILCPYSENGKKFRDISKSCFELCNTFT